MKKDVSVEEEVNNDIADVFGKIDAISTGFAELESQIAESIEKLQKIEEANTKILLPKAFRPGLDASDKEDNIELQDSDFDFGEEKIRSKFDELSKAIEEIEKEITELPKIIDAKIKSRLKNLSSEMISKKYNSTFLKLQSKLMELKSKQFDIQSKMEELTNTMYMSQENVPIAQIAKKQRDDDEADRIETERKKAEASMIAAKKAQDDAIKKAEDEKIENATRLFQKIIEENPEIEIGKITYKKTYIAHTISGDADPVESISEAKDEIDFGSKVLIALRKEFELTGIAYYHEDDSKTEWTGNPYHDDNAELICSGGKTDATLVFIPEEECTIDEMEEIEKRKKKIELLKEAMELDPTSYRRPGKIFLPKLEAYAEVTEEYLLSANLDPEELGWEPLEPEKKKIPSEKRAKQIIKRAKRESVKQSILDGISGLFKSKERATVGPGLPDENDSNDEPEL